MKSFDLKHKTVFLICALFLFGLGFSSGFLVKDTLKDLQEEENGLSQPAGGSALQKGKKITVPLRSRKAVRKGGTNNDAPPSQQVAEQKEEESVPDRKEALTSLQEAMASNKMAFAAKKEILVDVLKRLKSSELIRTFCRYLLSKRRMELLPAIGKGFEGLLMEQLDRLEAHVSVTHKLTDARVKKLEKTLSWVTGKQVNVKTSIDPDLIGGVVSRIGSTVIDGSIRNQLNQIRQSISQGGTL